MIPPSRLRAERIRFKIICSGPGEMVVTEPRQYHAVVNATTSFAVATNFTFPNEDPIPTKLSLCYQDGLYRLEHPMIRKLRTKRKEHDSQLEAPPRKKRPSLHKPLETPVVEILVRETTSRGAILRFMTVVHAWRKVDDDVRGQLSRIGKCDESLRLATLDTLRISCGKKSELFSFLEILTGVHLVRNLKHRVNNVVAPEAIDELLEARGLDKQQDRKSVLNELAACRKWDRLCGNGVYDGILCFVPPVFRYKGEVTRKYIQEKMSRADYKLFFSILQKVKYVERLCEVGKAFQEEIFGSGEFERRLFEAQTAGELSQLGLEGLLQLL
ncbi:hypothetical protein VTI74DRAFT_1969 [Chaetomium olivicolor]